MWHYREIKKRNKTLDITNRLEQEVQIFQLLSCISYTKIQNSKGQIK